MTHREEAEYFVNKKNKKEMQEKKANAKKEGKKPKGHLPGSDASSSSARLFKLT